MICIQLGLSLGIDCRLVRSQHYILEGGWLTQGDKWRRRYMGSEVCLIELLLQMHSQCHIYWINALKMDTYSIKIERFSCMYTCTWNNKGQWLQLWRHHGFLKCEIARQLSTSTRSLWNMKTWPFMHGLSEVLMDKLLNFYQQNMRQCIRKMFRNQLYVFLGGYWVTVELKLL